MHMSNHNLNIIHREMKAASKDVLGELSILPKVFPYFFQESRYSYLVELSIILAHSVREVIKNCD